MRFSEFSGAKTTFSVRAPEGSKIDVVYFVIPRHPPCLSSSTV